MGRRFADRLKEEDHGPLFGQGIGDGQGDTLSSFVQAENDKLAGPGLTCNIRSFISSGELILCWERRAVSSAQFFPLKIAMLGPFWGRGHPFENYTL